MGFFREINGDLIKLAKEGNFDVIAHGCNCFCTQKKGLAKQMAKEFKTHTFEGESEDYYGVYNKLGTIDFEEFTIKENILFVVNCYTQYNYTGNKKNLHYLALSLCLEKLNHQFKNKHIGLPRIGSGLARGDWSIIKAMIKTKLKDCNVTIVNYE